MRYLDIFIGLLVSYYGSFSDQLIRAEGGVTTEIMKVFYLQYLLLRRSPALSNSQSFCFILVLTSCQSNRPSCFVGDNRQITSCTDDLLLVGENQYLVIGGMIGNDDCTIVISAYKVM